jgi:glucose/arabinose dehydrogenase
MKLTTAIFASLAIGSAAVAGTTAIKPKLVISTGLTYPTFITAAPDDETRIFVLEKRGAIRIIDISGATPTLLTTPFLDIDSIVTGGSSVSDEQGLLGLAFDPDYTNNGQFYVYYTGTSTNNVARYTRSASNPNVANATGVVMMTWSDPYTNHNGGWIGFRPGTRHLFIAVGDGGSANDPGNVAQTLTSKLGKMHRISPTVGGVSPYYTIPTTNPFYGGAVTTDDTVWSYGLRNPWRCSFDRATGDLYIADVGQNAVEEVNYELATAAGGRNYGWRCTEGTSCTGLTGCTCNGTTLTAPVRTHTHTASGGYCITGGYVYRGCAMPDMQGIYFYADYSTNNSWSFRMVNSVVTEFVTRNSELQVALGGQTVNQIASFGEDANGEIYIADHGGGIYKIVPATGEVACQDPVPGDLNGDGIVNGADITIILSCWGTNCGDLNGDSTTDGQDMTVVLSNWTP